MIMKKLLLPVFILLNCLSAFSATIIVKNIDELISASKKAMPGDIIVLQNGEWNNVTIRLESMGTKEHPITFKAQSAGKVFITGTSRLAIGGNYLVIDGLYFRNGYSGKNAVIEFHSGKDQIANNCRVTNCVIDDFNNPKRLDENYWIAFYGKNNRLDHNSFRNKKNLGVLLAVILDDDRSRENFHSIDHNYFGRRIPLASNGGEIIRVGVSEHCQFNSNTQIVDNFFEHCDGETEIISIKSCSNVVKNNLFKECQGGVVLRHGNYNTVENNIFLGNGKEGTGGVRIINKGQWVVNNFFYKCRGVDFRSPLSIMNGIPNSPANRYVQVTDAVIANNTWMECSPISFCEGSDAERTLPPDNVLLLNNVFYNTMDTAIYHVFDNVSGIRFIGNELNNSSKSPVKSNLDQAFVRRMQKLTKENSVIVPISLVKGAVALPDSISKVSIERLGHSLSTKPGFTDLDLLNKIEANASGSTGAGWFSKKENNTLVKSNEVTCIDAKELYAQLDKNQPLNINLNGNIYLLDKPLVINNSISFHSPKNKTVAFITTDIPAAFFIRGNGRLEMTGLSIDGKGIKATSFISSSNEGSSNHYNLILNSTTLKNLDRTNGCENFFYAFKSMVADSIEIKSCNFENLYGNFLMMNDERDDKGYYSAEKISLQNNQFSNLTGVFINIYRGGNDESTMGPKFSFFKNKLSGVNSGQSPLISLTGVQVSQLTSNSFTNCNATGILVKYSDKVRARHTFKDNELINAGSLDKNQYVPEK